MLSKPTRSYSRSDSSAFKFVKHGVIALSFASGVALASAPRAASAQNGGPPPLPPEAYTSCASKADGDACTVQLREHTLEGTCSKHPADGRLFCRPSKMPPPPPDGQKGPPPGTET